MMLNLGSVEQEAEGAPTSPAIAYVRANGPKLQQDKWGELLPLSTPEQDRLDRMVAVLSHPLERGLALVLSGTLDPGECEALRTVHADAYGLLVQHARADMAQTQPPFAVWAEQTLTVLFGKPVAKVYGDEVAPKKAPPSGPKGTGPTGATQADRREVAVRQQKG